MKKTPNCKLWILGRECVEAAKILVTETKIWPAAVLVALSIEIFLKSFLARDDPNGYTRAQRGHTLSDLFSKIPDLYQDEIIQFSRNIDPKHDLVSSLTKFNDIFTNARYRYEEGAVQSVGNDIVIFARHLCDVVFELGKSREVTR